jgi:hypothetical protein
VWINDAEESFGDLRKLIVNFEVHAAGEEGERFQEAFDMRVLALGVFQDESAGDFWIFFCKIRAHLTDKAEFAFVVKEKVVTHDQPPSTE